MTKEFDDFYKLKCNPRHVIRLENLVYAFANKLSGGKYSGGHWKSVQVKVDEEKTFWYFNLDSDKEWVVNHNHVIDEKVSSKCFSLLAFTFALNYIASELYEDENSQELLNEVIALYYMLRDSIDLMLNKKETKIFYRIID